MKRIFPLFLILLSLWGCSAETEVPQTTPTLPAPVETVAEEPTGYYDPGSQLESTSGGTVQVYPLNRSDCRGMLPMGEDLLLFAGNEASTTLIKVSGDSLYITATAQLDCAITPENCGVQVSEKGVTFYDEATHELVFLDTGLKEVSRVSLPEDILGEPTLSADRKSLYYCTPDALRVLDLETGFHKLLKEMTFQHQTIRSLHFNDSVVECSAVRSDGAAISLFFSVKTGETLWEALNELTLTTSGDLYFAVNADGAYQELLVGTTDVGPYALYFDDIHAAPMPMLDAGGILLASSAEDGSAVTLHYFDLESGRRNAQLELSGAGLPRGIHADPEEDCIWLLRYDEAYGCDTLYRWEPSGSLTEDETVYITSRITYVEPDTEGLVRCQEKAAEVSIKHGVDVRVWTDAVTNAPDDYGLTAEYQVPVLLESLDALDAALARYPEKFLKKAARGTASGTLRICLVRSIYGITEGSPKNPGGIQFWDKSENTFLCLAVGDTLEQSLHHELYHVVDSRVLSTSSAFDDWDELNPEGFAYDYNYLTNQFREDYELLDGDSRAFIDMYSMSFPGEDRARIMEHAMMPGNEDLFTPPLMQAKLRQLCLGIRDAFDLDDAEVYPWEQYLAEPLA